MGINEKLNEYKTRNGNCFLLQMERKRAVGCWIQFKRERESYFSLDFPPFGPSVLIGPRSKVVLRGEGYAWTPIWWSFENSKR